MRFKLLILFFLTLIVYQGISQNNFSVDYQERVSEYLCEVENPDISVWYKLKYNSAGTIIYQVPKDEGQYYLCAYIEPRSSDKWYYQVGKYESSSKTFYFETELLLPEINFWQLINTPSPEFIEYNKCNK